MLKSLFVRKDGGGLPRGQLAEVPFPGDKEISYQDPWIVVLSEPDVLEVIPKGSKVFLRLDQLMEQYPNEIVEATGENGETYNYVVFGHFHEDGRNMKELPVLTIDDVYWIDPEGVTHGAN